MTHLSTFFVNIFSDPKITPLHLEGFTDDHLQRLAANNPGAIYNLIIADTQTARDTFHNKVVLKLTETGQRKGATFSKQTVRKTFINYMKNKEPYINNKFGKGNAGYVAFYPLGLTGWHKATDTGLKDLATSTLAALTLYSATLDAQFVTDLTALCNGYINAEDTQTSEKGDVSNARIEELVAEHALQIQLTINVHTIAINNTEGPAEEIANTFFDENLLSGHQFKHIFKGEVAPGTEKPVCSFTYHATSAFDLEHKSAKPQRWQMALNGVKVGNVFTTHIGEKLHKAFADFAADGDTLVVMNDEDVPGEYRVVQIS